MGCMKGWVAGGVPSVTGTQSKGCVTRALQVLTSIPEEVSAAGAGAGGGVTETWRGRTRRRAMIITRGEEGGWLVVVRGGERRCRCPWWCHRDLEKGERKQQ